MSEFMYDKEKYIEEHEQIIFENNTDSSFGVETGIIFHKSGLYDVDINNNHVVVSKVNERKAIEEAYQKGLDDAWECAKRIALTKTDVNCPYFTVAELEKIFGYSSLQSVFDTYSALEAVEKVKVHEQQKANEIKVSDIITDGKINYLVIDITDKSYVALQGTDFEPVYIGKDYIKSYHNLHDSKDMRKIAEEINKAMKGKQRNCYTCKHHVVNSIECTDCYWSKGYNRWEQKEVTE